MRIALIAIVVTSIVTSAHAQPGDASAIAEQLFREGRALAQAGRWTEACPKFEASLRSEAGLGVRLNLATCYVHIGKMTKAWALYRESIQIATRAGDARRLRYAEQQAAALEARLPELVISAPARRPEGFTVTRDGVQIESGALGVDLYADAGRHQVTASAPGFHAFTTTATLVEGQTARITIPELQPDPDSRRDTPTQSPGSAALAPDGRPVSHGAGPGSTSRPSRLRTYAALGLGSAGMVAAGIGLAFGAKASSTFSDAKDLCGAALQCKNEADFARGHQLVLDARRDAAIATGLAAAGAAAITAGAILYFTGRRAQESDTQIATLSYRSGFGLAVTGAF